MGVTICNHKLQCELGTCSAVQAKRPNTFVRWSQKAVRCGSCKAGIKRSCSELGVTAVSASPGTTRLFIFCGFMLFLETSWDEFVISTDILDEFQTRKKRMRCCWKTCHSTPFGVEKQAWTYTWWGCYGSEIKSLKPWEWVFATRSRSKIKMHQCNKAVFQPECQEEIAEKIDLQANPRTIFSTSGVFRFSLPF